MPDLPKNEAEEEHDEPTNQLQARKTVSKMYFDFVYGVAHRSKLAERVFPLCLKLMPQFIRVIGHVLLATVRRSGTVRAREQRAAGRP